MVRNRAFPSFQFPDLGGDRDAWVEGFGKTHSKPGHPFRFPGKEVLDHGSARKTMGAQPVHYRLFKAAGLCKLRVHMELKDISGKSV